MKNIKDFLSDWGNIISVVFLVLVFLQTCGTKPKVDKLQKEVTALTTEVDSLSKVIVTAEEHIEMIKETPAWQTLRLEEISDKERISINALEAREER